MEQNKKAALLAFIMLFTLQSNAQKDSCKILYPAVASKNIHEVINSDTVYFEKSNKRTLFLFNDKIVFNGKTIYSFKKIAWYAEITYAEKRGNNYLYIYPIYKGESGPYIWNLRNGVIIRIKDKPEVKKKNWLFG